MGDFCLTLHLGVRTGHRPGVSSSAVRLQALTCYHQITISECCELINILKRQRENTLISQNTKFISAVPALGISKSLDQLSQVYISVFDCCDLLQNILALNLEIDTEMTGEIVQFCLFLSTYLDKLYLEGFSGGEKNSEHSSNLLSLCLEKQLFLKLLKYWASTPIIPSGFVRSLLCTKKKQGDLCHYYYYLKLLLLSF